MKVNYVEGMHRRKRKKGEPPAPQRPCLTCRRPFASEWIGNRICQRCKNSELKPARDTTPFPSSPQR